jgi:two-component system, OmpR family, KDP operon response regulator KdpE
VTCILVVDDEVQIGRALRTSLQARGYDVLVAYRGETALALLSRERVDLVILDLGLPDLSGIQVLKRIRAFLDVPVIILTVADAQVEKVAALDLGADDYVTKPFAMDELAARMRAALRRSVGAQPPQPALRFGDLEIDLGRQLVRRGGAAVHLTPTEYRLLEVMATNPGKLLTHPWLVSKVWASAYASESQNLRFYVRQLRKKLEEEPSRPRLILTEPSVGYRWSADPSPQPSST